MATLDVRGCRTSPLMLVDPVSGRLADPHFAAQGIGGRIVELLPDQGRIVLTVALRDKFELAQARFAEAGSSIFDATPETWDMMERFLAAEFGVSQGVVGKRAVNDGLWKV